MRSKLPATHILRHFVLFALTLLFLLTFARAVYALWKFIELEETGAFIPLFVQGLRFDLALIGLMCIVPMFLGSLLGMFKITKGLAKFLIVVFLYVSLFAVLALELVTPWFIHTTGIRPDLSALLAIPESSSDIVEIAKQQWIVTTLGCLLCLLVLLAFWRRLETPRLLRYPISRMAGLGCAVVGVLVCVIAIWSTADFRQLPLGPGDALISVDSTVNELALNTPYKLIHSAALPYFNSLVETEENL